MVVTGACFVVLLSLFVRSTQDNNYLNESYLLMLFRIYCMQYALFCHLVFCICKCNFDKSFAILQKFSYRCKLFSLELQQYYCILHNKMIITKILNFSNKHFIVGIFFLSNTVSGIRSFYSWIFPVLVH